MVSAATTHVLSGHAQLVFISPESIITNLCFIAKDVVVVALYPSWPNSMCKV